jgi:DNA-binding transcriptional LysR family regulator
VGVAPTAPFHPFVPVVIREFRAAFPLVSLTLDECLGKEALERLRGEQMDVAFLRAPVVEPESLVVYPLLMEPMVVALPSDHALARSDCVGGDLSLKDFANETFIVYARQLGPAFYEATVAAVSRQGSALASARRRPELHPR